ncbi:MAG: hypothetical protein NZ651_05015 [Candidatus Bipolaricaulota bacterium]|nr:hypothetical protein [Candidatus Bipolaricaulota bacterium]MDW8127114.1 hypothetical protein [Candidatus Bipolaricaulota bacterium]
MRKQTGFWVERTPNGGYRRLPVEFFFDSMGNLIGMRDPQGNLKQFETTYSVSPTGQYYHATACDYFIATVPAERWVPISPFQWGFIDDTGRVWPLQHSIEDICRKRADVCDYLARRYNVYVPGSKPNSPATGVQAETQPQPRYVGCVPRVQNWPANTKATAQLDPMSQLPAILSLIDQFAMALLAFAPPGFREAYQLMKQEGMRQELILQQRLGPEGYKEFLRIKERINDLHNRGLITDEQWHRLQNMAYKAAVRRAGLTEEELLVSSPYMPALAKALSQLPQVGGTVSRALEQHIERVKTKEQVRQAIQRLTPEQRRILAARITERIRKQA